MFVNVYIREVGYTVLSVPVLSYRNVDFKNRSVTQHWRCVVCRVLYGTDRQPASWHAAI